MRICFIAENYPPTHGGVAKSTQRIAKNIKKHGEDVFVISFDNSRPVTVEDYVLESYDEDVLVYKIGPFFTKQKDLNLNSFSENKKAILRRRAFDTICRILSNEKFDCIMSFYLLNAGYISQLIGRHFNKPVIAGIRGNDIGRNIFNIEKFRVIEWVMEGASYIVCVNQYLRKRMLLAFPQFENKSLVIENGFNWLEIKPSKKESREKIITQLKWNKNDLIVAYIGYLREKKGALTLLEAFKYLYQLNKIDIRLLVIGPRLKDMEFKIWGEKWNYLIDNSVLECTGEVLHSEVYEIAAGADIIIMPSLDDGLANGLLEGMYLGLCPVVSDIFKEIIENDIDGVIVDKGNYVELANKLIELERNRSVIEILGKNAQDKVEKYFKPEKEAESYISLFKKCIDEYSGI